ncbi:MAG: L-threonylcarbamoyladenylate synthase [Candidatus Yanofskybacteria bacterium]|nr:L-threonylcarbamoyladenylate synthase [Candidatus Yanofskybacteria bacterium]
MEVIDMNKMGQEQAAEKAAELLSQGKVLVAPTDTVYGLLADASNEGAVAQVFAIKGRSREKELPLFVQDIAAAEELAEVSRQQRKFLESVWPGKVTVVLKSKVLGKETIGLRVPDFPFLSLVLGVARGPVTGTSANVSGMASASSAREAVWQFKNQEHQPDAVFDGGELPPSLSSTVVDLTGDKPKILRKGAVEIV